MPPLPVISGREAAKAFRKTGFPFHPQKGGHMIYYRSDGRHLSIPDRRELDRGTLRSLIKGAGISLEEFVDLL
ncbi:MAG: type II toxin-antitoxin system HicA family toxin [Deltaproteobacteria bacterium]|nr:type II toxin-antitoxin system HicA family toxin [Deltaproteobacteria bacterium]